MSRTSSDSAASMLVQHTLSLLLGTLFSVLSEACSPTGHDDFADVPNEHRAHLYDYVLVGQVLRMRPDPRFDYGGGSDVSTAAFRVYCSYKGGSLQQIINITEVGAIPGHCHATELQRDREYIILARKGHSDSSLKIMREIPLSKGELQTVIRACGLSLTFPDGLQRDESGRCLPPAPPGDCIENPRATPSDTSNVPTHNTRPNDSPDDSSAKLKSDHDNVNGNAINSSEPPQKHSVVCADSGSQRTILSYLSILLSIIVAIIS